MGLVRSRERVNFRNEEGCNSEFVELEMPDLARRNLCREKEKELHWVVERKEVVRDRRKSAFENERWELEKEREKVLQSNCDES